MARPTTSKQVSRLTLYAIITLVSLALIWWSRISLASEAAAGSGAAPVTPIPSSNTIEESTSDIQNGTLGFEAIFAINLPSRVDKRDNIILGASASGLDIEVIDAITPEQIDPKTYPYNWNHAIHRPIEYAARRSHLNVMQRILKDGLASAIIMEDDADWDVTLKTQLRSFALSVRALQSQTSDSSTTKASLYGNDWDIFWLGHCDPPPHERPSTSRMTCPITDRICSIVYAVSFRGAQKILAALSVSPSGLAEEIDIGAEFDVSLGRMCGADYLRCYAPYPALTGGYMAAGSAGKGSAGKGSAGKGSDINGPGEDVQDEGEGVREVQGPFSHGVMYSTMLNIKRILAGERTVIATWDDVPVKEIQPGNAGVIEGYIHVPGSQA
ncbi:hypothetical protein BDV19DRAFT_398938 [Aspergillus venezuelensis]